MVTAVHPSTYRSAALQRQPSLRAARSSASAAAGRDAPLGFTAPLQPFELTGAFSSVPFSPLWRSSLAPFLDHSDHAALICASRTWRWAVCDNAAYVTACAASERAARLQSVAAAAAAKLHAAAAAQNAGAAGTGAGASPALSGAAATAVVVRGSPSLTSSAAPADTVIDTELTPEESVNEQPPLPAPLNPSAAHAAATAAAAAHAASSLSSHLPHAPFAFPDEHEFAARVRVDTARNRMVCTSKLLLGRWWAPFVCVCMLWTSIWLARCLDAFKAPATPTAFAASADPAGSVDDDYNPSSQRGCAFAVMPFVIAILLTLVACAYLALAFRYRRVLRLEHVRLRAAALVADDPVAAQHFLDSFPQRVRTLFAAQWRRLTIHAGGVLPPVVAHVSETWYGLFFAVGCVVCALSFIAVLYRDYAPGPSDPTAVWVTSAHPFAVPRVLFPLFGMFGCVCVLLYRLLSEHHSALRPSLERFYTGQLVITSLIAVLVLAGAVLLFATVGGTSGTTNTGPLLASSAIWLLACVLAALALSSGAIAAYMYRARWLFELRLREQRDKSNGELAAAAVVADTPPRQPQPQPQPPQPQPQLQPQPPPQPSAHPLVVAATETAPNPHISPERVPTPSVDPTYATGSIASSGGSGGGGGAGSGSGIEIALATLLRAPLGDAHTDTKRADAAVEVDVAAADSDADADAEDADDVDGDGDSVGGHDIRSKALAAVAAQEAAAREAAATAAALAEINAMPVRHLLAVGVSCALGVVFLLLLVTPPRGTGGVPALYNDRASYHGTIELSLDVPLLLTIDPNTGARAAAGGTALDPERSALFNLTDSVLALVGATDPDPNRIDAADGDANDDGTVDLAERIQRLTAAHDTYPLGYIPAGPPSSFDALGTPMGMRYFVGDYPGVIGRLATGSPATLRTALPFEGCTPVAGSNVTGSPYDQLLAPSSVSLNDSRVPSTLLLADRGTCTFVEKMRIAQQLTAVPGATVSVSALLLVDNAPPRDAAEPDNPFADITGGSHLQVGPLYDAALRIPALLITQELGARVRTAVLANPLVLGQHSALVARLYGRYGYPDRVPDSYTMLCMPLIAMQALWLLLAMYECEPWLCTRKHNYVLTFRPAAAPTFIRAQI